MNLNNELIRDTLDGIQSLKGGQKRSMKSLLKWMNRLGHNFDEEQMFRLCYKIQEERGFLTFAFQFYASGDKCRITRSLNVTSDGLDFLYNYNHDLEQNKVDDKDVHMGLSQIQTSEASP